MFKTLISKVDSRPALAPEAKSRSSEAHAATVRPRDLQRHASESETGVHYAVAYGLPRYLQGGLAISQAGDAGKQHADRVAEQIMHTPLPAAWHQRTAHDGAAPGAAAQEPIQHETDRGMGARAAKGGGSALFGPGGPRILDSASSNTSEMTRLGHDFSRVPLRPGAGANAVASHCEIPAVGDRSVDGVSDSRFGLVEDNDPDGGTGPKDAGPPAGAPKKKAGVDSFEVKWTDNPLSGPKTAKLRLDYSAKFTKDATHDPAVAEFRQNAFHTFEVTAGPHKGQKHDNPPLHDDNYSRADDTAGNSITDVNFVSNDNPGAVVDSLDKDDVINYSFTAEQMIIDTGDANKVIAKRGPHTATIKGKHARAVDGVPKTFS